MHPAHETPGSSLLGASVPVQALTSHLRPTQKGYRGHMTSESAQRRHEQLRDFLRTRRARLTPGDVGILSAGRRRTPGLRREEVAMLAGVGVSWYTWLEQGRPINASVQVLDAVARTLGLDA